MTINPRFERAVLTELALSERRGRRLDPKHGAQPLAQTLRHGRHGLLAHLRRVALAVPRAFRPVSWLHHAREAGVRSRALSAAGLSSEAVAAVDLLAFVAWPSRPRSTSHRARALSQAPGGAGYLARGVASAAIEDRLEGAHPEGETLAALRLVPDPRLAR
jgi:hypothetical protein